MSADQHRDFNPDLRSRLKSHLPILQWLPAYRIEWLRGDIIAALTVWALYVLTGMAYATLAGVPAEAGLYYIGSAEGHEYPGLQVGDEVNPRPFLMPL
jgi:hypothetical protein